MNPNLYSNTEFQELAERINAELIRRSSYRWWDPLATPRVGIDRTSPWSLPADGERALVDDQTYTIHNPSTGSIEPTKNEIYPARGENPGGVPSGDLPNHSGTRFTIDEMRNFLVGLSKIHDIDCFYGRDEFAGLAFRDPNYIENLVAKAESDPISVPLKHSDLSPEKLDPTTGEMVRYPLETITLNNGKSVEAYVMPSGEMDGEEGIPGPDHFFDDHGAPEGDGNYHPYNPHVSLIEDRSWDDFRQDRNTPPVIRLEGGIPSSNYGPNPRNPSEGKAYRSRPAYGGKVGTCNVACTGLCHQTCDNTCSESCTTTCWGRCGNACSSGCESQCTGCSSQCYQTCRTKCENSTGYACVHAGALAVRIYSTGGSNGEPAQNKIEVITRSCEGCSYSCEFYPNKKTTCWDAGCMDKCFIGCVSSCSTSCLGGCIDNTNENDGSWKTGKGRGCSDGCTINCVGTCQDICAGMCIQTCYHGCMQLCTDNCAWDCFTDCGSGCAGNCTNDCLGTCRNSAESEACSGCSSEGCTSNCQHDCNSNCMGQGCRSICGTDAAGACSGNCRLNCSATSCTAECSDACASKCSSCVNTCGFQCGACSSLCAAGCGAECNVNCTAVCEQSCESNCVNSCSEACGGCSNLCYSCVGMCVGVCAFKCESNCTNCSSLCSGWCDNSCGRGCFSSCDLYCISACSGSCATSVSSETTNASGPERSPTAPGYEYEHPQNREEERESFRLFGEGIAQEISPEEKEPSIVIQIDDQNQWEIICPEGVTYQTYASTMIAGVFDLNETDGSIRVNPDMIDAISSCFGNQNPGQISDFNDQLYDSSQYENHPNADGSQSLFLFVFMGDPLNDLTIDDVASDLPFRFILKQIQKVTDTSMIMLIQYQPVTDIWVEE